MLPSTPWNSRSWGAVVPASWQVVHASEETAACPATDTSGKVVILNPPAPKLDAEWQALQLAVPLARLSGGMCVADKVAGVTMLTPLGSFQLKPTVWQVWQ